MQLQPPTDNLYKFLAIGGLAAIIAAAYFLNLQNSESYSRRLKLEQEFGQLLDEFHIKFGSDLAHEELSITKEEERSVALEDTLAYSVAYGDHEQVKKHINLHHRQLGKLMSSPNLDEETKQFWQKWFKLTKEELDAWQSGNPSQVDTIRSSAIEFRPRFERSLPLVNEIWMIEATFNRSAGACIVGIAVGFIVMVAGFLLWFFRVQQLHDQILRMDLAERKKKVTAP